MRGCRGDSPSQIARTDERVIFSVRRAEQVVRATRCGAFLLAHLGRFIPARSV